MPEIDTLQYILLIFARVTAFFVQAPFFSIRGAPVLLKAGLGIFLAFILFPVVPNLEPLPLGLLEFFILLAKEVIVGLTLGFVTFLTFSSIRVAGEFIDIQMGFAMASVLDPQSQSRITLVGQFVYILAIMLFFAVNGHHILLLGLTKSFELIPLTGAVFKEDIAAQIVQIFIGMFSLGFRIAAPVIAVLLISDIALGLLARTVPQLNVFMLGFPIKAGLGVFILSLILPILAVVISNILSQIQRDLLYIMEYLAP